LRLFAALLLFVALPAQASEALWSLLKGGGQVVLVRHAVTTPGVGDPPGFRLEDCATQRNLTDEGRGHAKRIGAAFRARGIPVERVLSSPWCRCVETARLAFGSSEPSAALGNLFGRPEKHAEQVAQMKALAAARPKSGNLVLVSHGSTISALTGVSPATAEMVIVTPKGNGKFSVAGRLRAHQSLITTRPFRAPHHTVSDAGLVGGGSSPRPGEASLAHTGVLFLDELPEFRRHVLDALRQPIEDGQIVIGRARSSIVYPARFMLAAAMNPCPCGYHGDGRGRCTCHTAQVQRYMNRVSGPILDRIDLHIEVPTLNARELTRLEPGESSAAIRSRVLHARDRQLRRFATRRNVSANAHMSARDVREFCVVDDASSILLRKAIQKLGLSARAYHRVLKLARTIADLEGADRIASGHIAEAIQYRRLDASF